MIPSEHIELSPRSRHKRSLEWPSGNRRKPRYSESWCQSQRGKSDTAGCCLRKERSEKQLKENEAAAAVEEEEEEIMWERKEEEREEKENEEEK